MINEAKHAYMIMAHHRFDVLTELLKDLDDERNDIFLHIDIKSGNLRMEYFNRAVQKANLIWVNRMNVHWGGYSQIKCVLRLLKAATSYGYHSYYHLMVGVEFPLKSQSYIHDFFSKNRGYEFIGFDSDDTKFIERIKYYHIFNEYARNNNFFQKILNKIRIAGVDVQKCLKIDISKKFNLVLKKGYANWSITHELAKYIVENEKKINKMYKHSFCGDEVFIHTLVYNSRFWKKVYDPADEYHSSMRITTWGNANNQFNLRDLDVLINSDRLFVRKVDGKDAMQLISALKESRKN